MQDIQKDNKIKITLNHDKCYVNLICNKNFSKNSINNYNIYIEIYIGTYIYIYILKKLVNLHYLIDRTFLSKSQYNICYLLYIYKDAIKNQLQLIY